MNYFVKSKIQEFEKSRTKCEKVIKTSHAIEFIIIYYSIIFYGETRNQNLVSKDLIEVIQTKFNKKAAMTSSWIRLLKESMKVLKYENFDIDDDLYKYIKILVDRYTNKGSSSISKDVIGILDAFLIIRNKAIAHNNSLDDITASFFLGNRFDQIPYELNKFLSQLCNSKFLLCTEDINCQVDNHISYFQDYSLDIIKNIEYTVDELDSDDIYVNSIYLFNEDLARLSSLSPFIIYRDNSFYTYTTFLSTKKVPEYIDIFNGHILHVPKLKEAFSSKIADDIAILGSKKLEFKLKFFNNITHNLPEPQFSKFIGREKKVEQIFKALRNRRIFLISVSGVGGVGKTAIVVKCANEIIKDNNYKFSNVIWSSAKKNILTPTGIEAINQTFTNINQLLDLVIEFTGFEEFLNLSFVKKKEKVLEILSLDSFLIIVDNFETLNQPKDFLNFFEEIGDVAGNTKIIITSRHQLGSTEKIIDLKEFDFDDYRCFVEYLRTEKFLVSDKIDDEMLKEIYDISGGLPLATEYIIGNINNRKSIRKILNDFKTNNITKENILKFSFSESFDKLLKQEVRVLFTIAMLKEPNINNICFVTDLDEFDVGDAIDKLKNISLINIIDDTFTMLPLTKLFITQELEKNEIFYTSLEAKVKEYEDLIRISREYIPAVPFANTPTDNIAFRLSKAAYILATQGEYSESEKYFDQASAYDNESFHNWYYRAISERDSNNRLVVEYFEKAIRYAPFIEKDRIQFDYVKTLLRFKKCESAIEVLEKIKNYENFEKDFFHVKGKAFFEMGKLLWRKHRYRLQENVDSNKYYEKSFECFKKSMIQVPELHQEKNHNVVCIYYMARIHRFKKDYGKALELLEKGLFFQPSNYKLLEQKEQINEVLERLEC